MRVDPLSKQKVFVASDKDQLEVGTMRQKRLLSFDTSSFAIGKNVVSPESDPDYQPLPGKPRPEPVKEPPGRKDPGPRPIDDPRPPKPKKKALAA